MGPNGAVGVWRILFESRQILLRVKPEIPKVALLIETSQGYGRAMLRGIVRYGRLHGPWRFYVTPGDFEQALPQMKQLQKTPAQFRREHRH